MFYQIFLSPQAKRWAIITYKHGIYELPHELPNNLRHRKLGKMIALSPAPPPPPQNKTPANTSKRAPKYNDRTLPAVRYCTRKLELVSNAL